jgi:hypothetical protein
MNKIVSQEEFVTAHQIAAAEVSEEMARETILGGYEFDEFSLELTRDGAGQLYLTVRDGEKVLATTPVWPKNLEEAAFAFEAMREACSRP